MNGIPPLKGLTAQDRTAWDKTYKDYLLRQGKTEDEIDKYYVAYQFQKKFGDELTNQIVDVNERINYYNNFNEDTKANAPSNSNIQRGMSKGEIYNQLEKDLYNSNQDYKELKDANFRLSNIQQNRLSRYTKDLNTKAQEEYDNMYPVTSEPIKLNPWDDGRQLIDVLGINKAIDQQQAAKTFQMIHDAEDRRQKEIARKDREGRMSAWKQEYLDTHYKDIMTTDAGIGLGGSPSSVIMSRQNEINLLNTEADKYAEAKEFNYQLDNTVVPIEKNDFVTINSKEDLQKRILELSSVYYNFRNSEWLHKGEVKINWDKLYSLVADDLRDGHVDRAKWNIDKYLTDEVIGKNQEWLNHDNMGHHGIVNSAVRQGTAMAVQMGVETLTAFPSLAVGAIQATINPTELQLSGGMNWFQRSLDNAVHNDWLLGLSNTSLADWGDELQENAEIYGKGAVKDLMRGIPTFTAMGATALDFAATRGGAALISNLGKKAVKSIERAAGKQIINQGIRAKAAIYGDKALSNTMQFSASYGEAVQQAMETERQIYKNAEESKLKEIRNIIDKELPNSLDVQSLPFTEEDLNWALSNYSPEIQQYFQDLADGKPAIPPEGIDMVSIHNQIMLEAKAKNIFDKRVPGYDDQVALAAHIESGTETALGTMTIFLPDVAFGGVDKALVNFAMGRKALALKTLGKRIDASGGFGKWATSGSTWKNIGLAGLNQAKIAAIETGTEIGQQSLSALGLQFGDFTAESFLMNHLYGDGSVMVGDVSYMYLSELDPERFKRDAALEETIRQTLITTLLMPNLGYRGKIKPTQRREGQSWLSNAIQQIHYYSPINTQFGNAIFNELAQNGQADAFATAINKYYNDPKNRATTNATTAVANYAIQMITDIANNDEVSFNNHQTSKAIAEAIAISMIEEDGKKDNHRQAIQNMAEIATATEEQKVAAIQSFREESRENPTVNDMTDEEILKTIEEAGKRINNIYNRVFEEQAKLDERYGRDRSNWQRRSALIFDVIAQEELQRRIEDKKKFINDFANSISEEDLGQSKQSVQEVNKSRTSSSKSWLLSGQDILRLEPEAIKFFLNPKNESKFSDEQNIIIKHLQDVILEKDPDGNLIKTIDDLSRERIQHQRLRKEYRDILKDENWTSKKVEAKATETLEEFSPNKKARKFQKAAIQTQSVSELRTLYNQEKSINEEKRASRRYDVDKALRDIKDSEVQKKITELDNIERAKNSLQSLINQSALDINLKDDLYNQVEDIANTTNNINPLYDISNYSLHVNPEEYDSTAGQLQEIINNAKRLATTAQSVSTEPVTEQKGTTQNPTPINLGNRDVDTAPAVNTNSITKLTVEEATEKIKEAQELLAANKYTEADKIIQEIQTRCPEGYKVVRGGTSAVLIKVNPEPIVTTVNVESEQPKNDTEAPTFAAPEDVIDTEEEIPYEDIVPIDTSLDTYPDDDIRSVTKVAVGRFKEDGPIYTFPIRDEQVDSNTRGQGSYTDKNGKTHTSVSGPLEIISVEEYNRRSQENPQEYKPLEEVVKSYPRPTFINRETNQEAPKQTQPTSNIIYEDDRIINTIESSIKEGITIYKVISWSKAKQKYFSRGLQPIQEELLTDESREQMLDGLLPDTTLVDIFLEEVRESVDSPNIIGEVVVVYHQADGSTVRVKQPYKLKTNPLNTSEKIKPIVKTNRTTAQQERLNKNITPARSEIAPQYLPKGDNYKAKEEGKEYTRLGDENYRNIDSQLEEQGAFEYRNSGRVQVGDKIQFVVSEEDMPDGSKQVIIWEVTTPKDKEIPEDSKFKGMQVLSVLDQTNMTGDRAALIARIREAYDTAGRPDSFLYDKESFEVSNIVGGVIPFNQTNPIEAKSNSTIESTNLKKGFTKKNGKYGTSFWNQRLGKMVHCPVIFKQLIRSSDGSVSDIISNPNVASVETVKHQYASQSETNEVMLVVPTPTGYKAAHSVYVMRRDIENAIDKYIQAIRNGRLGEELIARMSPRLTDNKAKTFFSDFLRFNRGVSERIVSDKNYKRLELGYNNNGTSTTLLYATQIDEDKYVITEQDARNILNDNEGRGFTFAEIAKEYLSSLVQNDEVGASVQINMNAIKENNGIINSLIEDGFLWAPNSINARFGMENTGFSAPISQETKQEQQQAKKAKVKPEPKDEPKTAPVEKLSDEPINKPKKQVPQTTKKDYMIRSNRRKLSAESKTEIPTPNPVQTEETNITTTENNTISQLDYNSLNEEQKQHIQEKGFTEESWNSLTQLEKENVLNC